MKKLRVTSTKCKQNQDMLDTV